MRDAVLSLWDEPRAPNPPAVGWQDWTFVSILAVAATAEVALRPDVVQRPLAMVLGVAPIFLLLWRRSNPLAVVTIVSALHLALVVAPIFDGHHETSLYSAAFVLLLPYALLRWGPGRDAVIGVAIIVVSHLAMGTGETDGVIAALAGGAILLLPAALGAAVRYRAVSRVREVEQIKASERELIARELHDTVAHHVSAIAIQAQAGRAIAASDPEAAAAALEVIAAEASRTLAEMRTMVGVLRQGHGPTLAPQMGVADLASLAERAGGPATIEVVPSGDLENLTPTVDVAVYRLAQEAITNARRHARRATRIDVAVTGDDECVRLTVSDDGESPAFATASSAGFGIVGMTERATLLGGTLEAGPNHDRGWTVTAVLPRAGASR